MGQKKSTAKDAQIDFGELKKCTHFNFDEVHSFYLQFRSEFPDGMITREQFMTAYEEKYPGRDAGSFAELVFRTYDEDGNGVVDFREFLCALSVTSRGRAVEKLRWSFRLYDIDGSGFICRDEAAHIVRAILRLQGRENPQTVESHMHRIFVTLDKNRDDRLSEEEFISGAQSSDIIAQLLKDEDSSSDSDD